MTKLECSVYNCTYNCNRRCERENITIGGHEARKPSETACNSFYLKGTNTMTSLADNGGKEALNICCHAVTCRYNENKKCTAGEIAIAGLHALTNGETECGTFQCE